MTLILNSVIPTFAIIALGNVLKRFQLIDDTFIRMSDSLIYYIFFPALLFWKIGKPSAGSTVETQLILAVFSAVFCVFLLSLMFVKLLRVPDYAVGSFSQGCFRFSTYIGMAVMLPALGEGGVRQLGVLIGFVIPFINVLAVSTLIWFSGEGHVWSGKAVLLIKTTLLNPLIIACVLGIVYSHLNTPFPGSVDNTLRLLSLLALPLALISIGGSLTVEKLRGHLKYASAAASFKLIILPAVGYSCLRLFHVSGLPFTVAMIYFALPTSPANYILSAQLNSDVDLATAAIVFSTLLSIGSLSAVLMIFG
ncbi:MAG: AEC family transporter [Desulfomonilaceae bacterium]